MGGTGPVMTNKDGATIWVEAERARQDRKWGGYDHDAKHTTEDWVNILHEQLNKLDAALAGGNNYQIERGAVHLTAVGFAMLEQLYGRGGQLNDK